MDYSGLTLVRATPEQAEQTYKNHWPRWGQNSQLPFDKYNRMREVCSRVLPGDRWAVWVLVPRDDPTTLDLRAHCETYQRPALLLRKGSSTPEVVVSYGIAGVFCAPNHVGHNFAKHMMKLLHYVIAPPATLPSFPAKWGAAPKVKGFQDATFSNLYSGIGTKYYESCRKGDTEPGWVYHQITSRKWTLDPQKIASQGGFEILRESDMPALEEEFSRDLRTNWVARQDQSKDSVVVLPDDGIFMLDPAKYENFARGGDLPQFPLGDHMYGVKTPSGWMRCFAIPEKEGTVLKITHVDGEVPVEAVLAAAKEGNCTKAVYWGPYEGWDTASGVEIKRDEEAPAIAVYGLSDDSIAWTLNEGYAWC